MAPHERGRGNPGVYDRVDLATPPRPAPELPRPRKAGRAAEWQRLLDEGTYRSRAELARAVGVSRAAVTKALGRLAARETVGSR